MKNLFILITVFFSSHFLHSQWSLLDHSSLQCRCLATDGANLFVGTDSEGVLRSTNNGITWDTINNGLTEMVVRDIEINGSVIYVGTWNGIFRSNDNGSSWTPINNGLTNLDVRAIVAQDSIVFIGTAGGGVFKSSDNGANWTAINNGLGQLGVLSLAVDSLTIYAGTYSGIFKSTDGGNNWNSPNGVYVQTSSIDIKDSIIIAGTIDGVFKSENLGGTWTNLSNGITEDYVTAVLLAGTNMFAGTWGESVFLSLDSASTWSPHNSGFSGNYISDFAIHNNKLIVSTLYEGVWELSGLSLGNKEIEQTVSISVYPNPARDILNFTQVPKTIEILNQFGQVVKKYDQKKVINITALSRGQYFVRIETNEGVEVKKIIIE